MTQVSESRWWKSKREGLWVRSRGWTLVRASVAGITPKGTAMAHSATKRIIFRDDSYLSSSVRDREYVMLHEIAHAVHFEVLHYVSAPLVTGRGLDFDDAQECVADAYCYRRNWSASMKAWVEASVRWHKLNTTAQYTMSDVRSSEARQIVNQLKAAVGV